MIPIVCVVGKSGAGKTYVIERVVAELKNRGYRVATVKHSAHGFELDKEGKDSWQHAQAGSDAVVISSPQKFAMIRKSDRDYNLAELSRFIGPDFDIILAEGFKRDKAFKIEIHRREQGADLICGRDELLAVVTDEQLERNVPQFAPDDTMGLVDLIEKRYLKQEDKAAISLFVNGKPVPLNDFVRRLFSNTLFGMVSALKGIPKARNIDISVRRARK